MRLLHRPATALASGLASTLASVLAGALMAACGDPMSPRLESARATPGDTLWASVTVGGEHACGLTAAGRAFCWGSNAAGQLGTTTRLATCATPVTPASTPWSVPCAPTPRPVDGGYRFTELALTHSGTCGRSPNGAVACWGGGSTAPPRQVTGAPALRAIAAGQVDNVCGLDGDGRAWCWSLPKATGGTGYGDTARTGTARRIPGDVRFVSLGNECGATADGALYCWNSTVDTARFDPGRVALDTCRFTSGREGRVTTVPCSPAPVRLRTTVPMRQPAPLNRNCALARSGVPYCWGWAADAYGGPGPNPRPLPAPEPLVELTGGGLCGRAAGGAAYCRGYGSGGTFGNGSVATEGGNDRWTHVAQGWTFAAVSMNGSACGRTAGGAVACWGSDMRGQLGSDRQPPAEACWNPLGYDPPPTFCVARPRPVASIAGL